MAEGAAHTIRQKEGTKGWASRVGLIKGELEYFGCFLWNLQRLM